MKQKNKIMKIMKLTIMFASLLLSVEALAQTPQGGIYLIQAVHNEQCWHVRNASRENRGDIITWNCRNLPHFRFRFVPVRSQFFKNENLYYIVDSNSGRCLHIQAASIEDRAPVWTWACDEVENRTHAMFKLIPTGRTNTYYIQDRNSGKCLHVRDASDELRSPIWTWPCNEIEKKSHGMFRLRSPNSL